nr:hypothetical protein [uncultured Carboxylicivirga sp.]
MDKRQNQHFKMYKVVLEWVKTILEKFSAIPGFADTLAEFENLLTEISKQNETTELKSTSQTQSKKEARERLVKLTLDLISILKLHASFNNDVVLLNDVDFTVTQLKQVTEQTTIARAQKVIGHAQETLTKGEVYNLSDDKLAEIQSALDVFASKQTNVRSAIVERKGAGEQLEALMDQADDLLKGKLDLIMEMIGITHPELLNQYKSLRIIVDR